MDASLKRSEDKGDMICVAVIEPDQPSVNVPHQTFEKHW